MESETIKRVVGGIERKIVAEVDNGKSHVEFYEDGKLQMIIDIPEDVINLENAKFKKRKYAYIFDYFLYIGIQDLLCAHVGYTLSTRCIRCEVKFVFYNKNDIEIMAGGHTASYDIEINNVKFKCIKYCSDSTYRELNELKKDNSWEKFIVKKIYQNEHNEYCAEIQVGEIKYTMLCSVYNKLTSSDYLRSRNFFKEGSTLFDITKEQNRLFTKNTVLKKQKNFIKDINPDGTIVV